MTDWRDKPATVGEVYDALISSAEAVKLRTKSVEDSWRGQKITKQLLRYAGVVQVDLFLGAAEKLKEKAGG